MFNFVCEMFDFVSKIIKMHHFIYQTHQLYQNVQKFAQIVHCNFLNITLVLI